MEDRRGKRSKSYAPSPLPGWASHRSTELDALVRITSRYFRGGSSSMRKAELGAPGHAVAPAPAPAPVPCPCPGAVRCGAVRCGV